MGQYSGFIEGRGESMSGAVGASTDSSVSGWEADVDPVDFYDDAVKYWKVRERRKG